jgi:hypothetical protein
VSWDVVRRFFFGVESKGSSSKLPSALECNSEARETFASDPAQKRKLFLSQNSAKISGKFDPVQQSVWKMFSEQFHSLYLK